MQSHSTPDPTVAAGSQTRSQAESSRTILFVEDDDSVRRVLARYLSMKGFVVLAATDASTAEPLWQQHRESIDMLITDLTLPNGVTGVELATRLQAEKPGLQVIINSGYAGASAPLRPRTHFLAKPYRPQQLLDLIESAFATAAQQDKAMLPESCA